MWRDPTDPEELRHEVEELRSTAARLIEQPSRTQRRQAELEGRESKALRGQRLPNSFRQILRDEIAEVGLPFLANERLRRDRHTQHLTRLGAAPEHSFFRQSKDGPPVLRDHFQPRQFIHHGEVNSAET